MNDGYEIVKDSGELYAIKKIDGRNVVRYIGKHPDYKSSGKLLSNIPPSIKHAFYDIQRAVTRVDSNKFNNKRFASCVRDMQNELNEIEAEIIVHDDESVTLRLYSEYATAGEFNYTSKAYAVDDIDMANEISNLTINYTE
jgi:hypothetical protein